MGQGVSVSTGVNAPTSLPWQNNCCTSGHFKVRLPPQGGAVDFHPPPVAFTWLHLKNSCLHGMMSNVQGSKKSQAPAMLPSHSLSSWVASLWVSHVGLLDRVLCR